MATNGKRSHQQHTRQGGKILQDSLDDIDLNTPDHQDDLHKELKGAKVGSQQF
jgi:hypothetical protein